MSFRFKKLQENDALEEGPEPVPLNNDTRHVTFSTDELVSNGGSDEGGKQEEEEREEAKDEERGDQDQMSVSLTDPTEFNKFTCRRALRKIEGKVLILISAILFGIVFSLGRHTETMAIGEFSALTFLFVSIFSAPIVFYNEKRVDFHGKAKFIFPRAFSAGIYGLFGFWAAKVMDYGDAIALNALVPVFAAMFSRILWKERVTIFTLLALSIGVTGVLLIAKPPFLFGSPEDVESQHYTYSPFFVFVPLTGSLMLGLSFSFMRKVGKQVSSSLVSAIVGASSCICSVIFHLIIRDEWVSPHCYTDRILVVCSGLGLAISLIALNRGLVLERSGPGTLMKNFEIVTAYFIQLMFHDSMPSSLSLAGAVLVICSCVIAITAEYYC